MQPWYKIPKSQNVGFVILQWNESCFFVMVFTSYGCILSFAMQCIKSLNVGFMILQCNDSLVLSLIFFKSCLSHHIISTEFW
jgi:hypothetical protein